MYENLVNIFKVILLFVFLFALIFSLHKELDLISSFILAVLACSVIFIIGYMIITIAIINYSNSLVNNTGEYTITQEYTSEIDYLVRDISYGLSTGVNFNTSADIYVKYPYNSNTSNDIYTFFIKDNISVLSADNYTVTTDVILMDVAYSSGKYYLEIYPRPKIGNYLLFGESYNKIIEMCKITREIDVTLH